MRVGLGDNGVIVSASIVDCVDDAGNAVVCPGLPAGVTADSNVPSPATGAGPFTGSGQGAGFGPFSFIGGCAAGSPLANSTLCNSPIVGSILWLLLGAGAIYFIARAK